MKLRILIFFFFGSIMLQAQTCGFGCLGLSGAFGGYTFQQYKADGIESIIKNFRKHYNFGGDNPKFERAQGFKIGANIFRANFTGYFLTAKAYYQFLKEEKKIFTTQSEGPTQEKYTLKLNHWGVGIDFGIPLFHFLDLKLVEGGVTFFNSSLENQVTQNRNELIKVNFTNSRTDIGYYVGTGLILHLIKDYVSIEGTAFYHKIDIKELLPEQELSFVKPLQTESYINKGGFGANVQLNIGFPL